MLRRGGAGGGRVRCMAVAWGQLFHATEDGHAYRWPYKVRTGGLTRYVQVALQGKYRWSYNASTGGLTRQVQVALRDKYRWPH